MIKKQRKLSDGSMPRKLLSTLTLYLGMLLPAVILIQQSFSSLRTNCLTNTKDEKSNKSAILLTSQWSHECPTVRKLTINADTCTLRGFINSTLRALSSASSEITGSDRPIEHLAKYYDKFKSIDDGFWAEFGVYNGNSLLMAHDHLVKEQSTFKGVIAGFDSFEGLPEKWRGGFEEGVFATQYEIVRKFLPERVEVYKGWFQDTIQVFKARHGNIPAALIHHDGDLFLSTTITLQLLDDQIVQGTHMIFDELVGYPGYEGHEIMALWLWMSHRNVTLCAMGHGGPVRIEEDISQWLNPSVDVDPTSQSAWFQVVGR